MDAEPIDPYDLADPVDITAKLPGNFFELLASKKWQERREALDALVEAAKTPRIADKDYSELMGALAKVQISMQRLAFSPTDRLILFYHLAYK